MAHNYHSALQAQLGLGNSLHTALGAAQAATSTPEPPAFVVPILLEDGTQRAVVVDERWTRTKDPMPLMTTEQANAMAKLLNEEWHEKQEALRLKQQEEYRRYMEQMKAQGELVAQKLAVDYRDVYGTLTESDKYSLQGRLEEALGERVSASQQKWVDRVKQQYNDWRKGK